MNQLTRVSREEYLLARYVLEPLLTPPAWLLHQAMRCSGLLTCVLDHLMRPVVSSEH